MFFISKRILFKIGTQHQCGLYSNARREIRWLTKDLTNSPAAEPASTAATKEWQQAKPYEDIPTISLVKFMYNIFKSGKAKNMDPSTMIMAIREELGPIAKLNGVLGRPDMIFTHNPEDFGTLLRNEGIWPLRPGSDGLNYHRSVHRREFFQGVEGLIGTQGEQWGSFRSVVNPVLLQPKTVRLYLSKMSQVNMEFLQRIIDIRDPHTLEMPENFEEELNRWALESISMVALDKQLGIIRKNRNNADVLRLFRSLTDLFKCFVQVEFQPPIWKYYKTPTFRKMLKILDDITDTVYGYVNEAVQRIEEQQRLGVPEKPESEQSVLEKLIKIDKRIAVVMAMDLLMAGVDTTTSAFTALLLCLAKNPEKQEKLRQEVLQLLPRKDSPFDEQKFNNMPYLRACLKESLRVMSLTLGTARLPVNDIILSGFRVPKGTQVMAVNAMLINNDEYFMRANEFLPERWLRSPKEEPRECPYARDMANPLIYIPFGYGPRSCVGRRITEMEMEIAAARLVRNFHIEFNHPIENAFKTLLIKVPNIPLKFKFSDIKE